MREPRDWSAEEWRAIEVFAGFIEREARGEDASFEVLLEGNPDLRDILIRLKRGRRTLLRTVEHRGGGGAARRSRKGPSAAATSAFFLLLAASFVTVWPFSSPAPPSRDVAQAAARFMDAGLEVGKCLHRAANAGSGVAASLEDSSVASLAMFHAVRKELGGRLAARSSDQDAEYTILLHDLEARFSDQQRRLFQEIVERGDKWPKSVDPELSALAVSLAEVPEEVLASLPELAQALYSRLRPHRSLTLKVIDRDHDGIEIREVDVYVQSVNPFTGAFGPYQYVGRPPTISGLPLGDVRLTAIARATPRYSELRLFVYPGRTAPHQVMFLRSTNLATSGMVAFPDSEVLFGRPAHRTLPRAHFPGRSEPVASFWIDRRETSYAEYAKFIADLSAHPSWFEFDDGTRIVPLRLAAPFTSTGTLASDVASNHALSRVSWSEAVLYANWAGKRLPTEREWERAAEGPLAATREYPWGDTYDERCVTKSSAGATLYSNAPVDGEPAGATPLGIVRMADGVSEWVEDAFVWPASDRTTPFLELQAPEGLKLNRAARGGETEALGPQKCLTDVRRGAGVDGRSTTIGIRCAKSSYPAISSAR